MKTILNRCGWCVLLAVSALVSRAGAPAPAPAPAPPPTTTLPATAGSPVAPLSSGDSSSIAAGPLSPNGFAISTDDPEKAAEQTMAFQAQQHAAPSLPVLQAQQQAADDDRDWMLRDYTARLQKAGLAPATPAATDPGSLPDPSATPAAAPDAQANPPDASKEPSPFPTESESKPELNGSSLSSLSTLQPLLPPLNPPETKTPRDPWSTSPFSHDFAQTTDLTPTPGTPGENGSPTSSLDVPGLTAAESGMSHAAGSLDFEGALPDDSSTDSRKIDDQNNFLVPTAPTSDVTEFFKKQSEGLKAPAAPTVAQAPTVVARPVAPTPPPEPIAKPAVSGLRSHVDDPFDILRQ